MASKVMVARFSFKLMRAWSGGKTMTCNVPAAEAGGAPSSVTRSTMVLVPALVALGVQVKRRWPDRCERRMGPPGSMLKSFIWRQVLVSGRGREAQQLSAQTVQFDGKESCGGKLNSVTKTKSSCCRSWVECRRP